MFMRELVGRDLPWSVKDKPVFHNGLDGEPHWGTSEWTNVGAQVSFKEGTWWVEKWGDNEEVEETWNLLIAPGPFPQPLRWERV